jgi:hypothetical protein
MVKTINYGLFSAKVTGSSALILERRRDESENPM